MFLNDPLGGSADGLRRQDVLILFDGQDLPSHQAGHADPVQKAEDNEHGDHVRAEVREQRDLGEVQGLLEDDRQKDDDEQVGEGVDDIDDAHHPEVHTSAGIAGDSAVQDADDKDHERREHTDEERHAGAVDHTDEVVSGQFVRTHDVGEDGTALVDVSLLHRGIVERSEVRGGRVSDTVDGDHLLIAVGNEERSEDHHEDDQEQNDHTHDGQRVLHEAAHTVPEERRGLRHDVLLTFFGVGGRFELFRIHLQREEPLFWGGNIEILRHKSPLLSQSSLIRGSTILYRMSLTRFMRIMMKARKMVVPMIMV